eukprot:412095-Rhodomonas_salina.2
MMLCVGSVHGDSRTLSKWDFKKSPRPWTAVVKTTLFRANVKVPLGPSVPRSTFSAARYPVPCIHLCTVCSKAPCSVLPYYQFGNLAHSTCTGYPGSGSSESRIVHCWYYIASATAAATINSTVSAQATAATAGTS